MLLGDLKLGDDVIRYLGGYDGAPMRLTITEIKDGLIYCGPWTFDESTGAEVDEDLEWGPPPLMTGSFIERA
jgi:hypothetical protein